MDGTDQPDLTGLSDPQDLSDLTDMEARVTAQDRLDLHFEHQDALSVERGSMTLAQMVRRASHLRATVGPHTFDGEILVVGEDWVQLSTAVLRLGACDLLQTVGSGRPEASVLTFRQAIRQYAGRIPREVVGPRGESQVVVIEWVAADFLHVRAQDRQSLIPLAQVAGVFGRLGDVAQ